MLKARISYQHCTGRSQYDREFLAEAPTVEAAIARVQEMANKAIRGIGLPNKMGWENRVYQGDSMITVMYDF